MKLRYLKSFLGDLEKLKDKKTKQQIKAQIEQIKQASAEKQSEITQLKKIKGHPYAYRIRIGISR